MGGGGQSRFVMKVSRYHYYRFGKHLLFFTCLTAVPLGYLTYWANTRVGVAELIDTPPGYEPQYYEYYYHPITRWLVRNLAPHPQRHYEMQLAQLDKAKKSQVHRMVQDRAKVINARLGESFEINDQIIVGHYKRGRMFNEKTQFIQSPNSLYLAKDTLPYSYDDCWI